jgi:hypothetical protein
MAVAKFAILRELFDLSREQRARLEEDRIDLVLELMSQRGALIRDLEQLFAESREMPDNVIAFPSPSTTDWSQQDELALDTLIRGILEHDQENEHMLQERLEAIQQALPRLERGRRATNAYRLPSYGANFIDRVS